MGEWTVGEISRRRKMPLHVPFCVVKHCRISGYCFFFWMLRMNEHSRCAAMCGSHISYVQLTVNPYSTEWLCYSFIMRVTTSLLLTMDASFPSLRFLNRDCRWVLKTYFLCGNDLSSLFREQDRLPGFQHESIRDKNILYSAVLCSI